MKTVIEMAKQAGAIPIHKSPKEVAVVGNEAIERFAELVRADERNRLADKLTQDFKGAFGADTCASLASWIRGQK